MFKYPTQRTATQTFYLNLTALHQPGSPTVRPQQESVKSPMYTKGRHGTRFNLTSNFWNTSLLTLLFVMNIFSKTKTGDCNINNGVKTVKFVKKKKK